MTTNDLIPRLYFLPVLICLAFAVSCTTTEPSLPVPPITKADSLTLSSVDVTHRSATLNIKTTQHNTGKTIELRRDYNSTDTVVAAYSVNVLDTTIIDDHDGEGLLLDTDYNYYAVRLDSLNQPVDSSETVTITTLAATSHNYTWQEFTIGELQSTLYDVWGTSENNVYACGTVIINDTAYGVVKWNGNEWKPEKRIGGLRAIHGFSEGDIWTVGGGVWYYDGNNWMDMDETNNVLKDNRTYISIWGTSGGESTSSSNRRLSRSPH